MVSSLPDLDFDDYGQVSLHTLPFSYLHKASLTHIASRHLSGPGRVRLFISLSGRLLLALQSPVLSKPEPVSAVLISTHDKLGGGGPLGGDIVPLG